MDSDAQMCVETERVAINNSKVVDTGFFLSAMCKPKSCNVEWVGFINEDTTQVKVAVSNETPVVNKKITLTVLTNITKNCKEQHITVVPKTVSIYGNRYIVQDQDNTVYYVIAEK